MSIRELVMHTPCHPDVGIAVGKAMQDGAPLTALKCNVMDESQVLLSCRGVICTKHDPVAI